MVFDFKYFNYVILLKIINKILFITLVLDVINKRRLTEILSLFFVVFILTATVYYYFFSVVGFKLSVLISYLLACILATLSFSILLFKNNKKARYLFLTIFILLISETVFGISRFIDKSNKYFNLGFFILSFARYYLYLYFMEANNISSVKRNFFITQKS